VSSALRWRIPPAGDPRVLRVKLAQIGLASVVCALVLLVAAPREAVAWGLLALAPVAVQMAYRQWHRYQQSLAGPANTWLDAEGLHWLDAAGNEQRLPRAEITGFEIAHSDETLRPVPALTLLLTDSRTSQPLELHPPADADVVRQWLADEWQLAEKPGGPAGQADYDLAVDVYCECHDEFQEWHLEGTAAALIELFDLIGDVASLPLAAPGVLPTRRLVLARRRDASRVAIERDRQPRIDRDTIGGPADLLAALAAQGRTTIAEVPNDALSKADRKFDLVLGRTNVWTFHLHLRQP
jgi:hypothetical protein